MNIRPGRTTFDPAPSYWKPPDCGLFFRLSRQLIIRGHPERNHRVALCTVSSPAKDLNLITKFTVYILPQQFICSA